VSAEKVHALVVEENARKKEIHQKKAKKLKALGFEAEHAGEILF